MPIKAEPRRSIAQIFEPRRVAVFGASDDRAKWGGRIMHYLALHGFAGEVVPLNPRRDVDVTPGLPTRRRSTSP